MQNKHPVSRRRFLQESAAIAGGLALLPSFVRAEDETPVLAGPGRNAGLYAQLLKQWCDGLIALQVRQPGDPSRDGAFTCPACSFLHGRCADALYPLMRLARTTGDSRYLDAAVRVQAWSDNVTQPDGSWLNEVTGSDWKGITVFATIALAEALHFHGDLLDASVRERWRERLLRAVKFLDGFMSMDRGNINYPVTTSLAFATAGRVLGDAHFLARGREFAHNSLKFLTPNNFLFGEGKPHDAVTPKGIRPIDLGYNVEESLPALALYGLMMDDREVLEKTVAALRTHMEFLLPDGGWDNSWGSRSYKWTWWGSRTSDGCQPAYALLAKQDPRFREVAWRNLEQLAACTHNGLLYGGPHYFLHGEKPCVHHTFAHAKALACVLDHAGTTPPEPTVEIPRDRAYGIKSYPETGVSLVSVGSWRATVTENDWEYRALHDLNGQPAGGALSMLYHAALGPIIAASMTEYHVIEPANQQKHGKYPTMCLTPRIEGRSGANHYTSLSDLKAKMTTHREGDDVIVEATGRLETENHEIPTAGEVRYRLVYRLSQDSVKISAALLSGELPGTQLIVPVISAHDEHWQNLDAQTLRVQKRDGLLRIHADVPNAFEKTDLYSRVFNLVPGFECQPLMLALPSPGKTVSLEFRAA